MFAFEKKKLTPAKNSKTTRYLLTGEKRDGRELSSQHPLTMAHPITIGVHM